MRIGIIADAHLGYSRGTKEENGINIREMDVLESFSRSINLLVQADVECVLDLGDLFHVPHPRKRALLHAINAINSLPVPFISANGNHTLVRTKSDIHVYDLLSAFCPRFRGYTSPSQSDFGVYLIPYAEREDVEMALQSVPPDTKMIIGHWACSDADFPGNHIEASLLPDIPTFLGHWHHRKVSVDHSPTYVGALETFAWGEYQGLNGVGVYDTEEGELTFVGDGQAREWVDLMATGDNVVSVLKDKDLDGKIVRLSVEATPSEYHGIDIAQVRYFARSALEFQIRRTGSTEAFTPDTQDTQTYSLLDAWRRHLESSSLSKVQRNQVRVIGEQALSTSGALE